MADPTAPKKGLSGLAIAGIGCGGLFIIVVLAGGLLLQKGCSKIIEATSEMRDHPVTAGAKLIVAMNPNLELIKADETTKEITIKDKQSGQVMTMSLDDMQKGKFKVSDDKGNETVVDTSGGSKGIVKMKTQDGGETIIGGSAADTPLPAWAPAYPGAAQQQGGMRVEKDGKLNGMASFQSADPVAKVKDFYDAKLKEAGFKTEVNTMNFNGKDSATVNATKDGGQKVGVIINADEGKTNWVLSYEGPK